MLKKSKVFVIVPVIVASLTIAASTVNAEQDADQITDSSFPGHHPKESLYEKMKRELPAVTILPNAIQPRTPSPRENFWQRKMRDKLVDDAIYADIARLHNMIEGLKAKKAGQDPKPACDKMMGYLDKGFTHIEGIEDGPVRTAPQLHGVCTTENKWVISQWEMTCIQPTVVDDHTVHLVVRYWHDQSDYTGHPEHKLHPRYLDLPEDQRPFFVPRIAVRTLVRARNGKMVIARHSAFDVKGKAVLGPKGEPLTSEICKPLPALERTPASL